MAIFLNSDSKVIVQGMTGSEGRKHTHRMLTSGTRIVGGVTPPTIRVPEVNMRWVCLRPSEPVMPWTMTFESEFRKIAMTSSALQLAASSAARRAAPSIVSTCSSPGRFAAARI